MPVIDLHCDLLSYLEEGSARTAHDLVAHCSIPQLKAGHVKMQTMAVFTKTGPESIAKGMKQLEIFKSLPKHYLNDFYSTRQFDDLDTDRINILFAIENASGFCSEQEPLQAGLDRLNSVIQEIGKPLYIGMTWNTENRFGGGNLSKIGLKEDGKYLLEELHEKKIGIDLSHTSDALAYGILDYLENKNLSIPVLASHSNARKVVDAPRNLPDELAKEIFRRGGVIGLNFYRKFVGESPEWFTDHVAHWLELGGESGICFGADFFYEGDFPNVTSEPYFQDYQNADCYGRLIGLIKEKLGLNDDSCKKLAYDNAKAFLTLNALDD